MLDVIVVGGGPVGLFLACLLARRGLSVRVLERRTERSGHSRAIGIHPPALEAFEEIGLTGRLLENGVRIAGGLLRGEREVLGELTFAGVSGRYPFIVSLPQHDTEELLERRLGELAPDALRRGARVTRLQDCGAHVRVTFDTPEGEQHLRARFVVGADGVQSVVRQLMGVPTVGRTYADTYLMGDYPDTTVYGAAAVISLPSGGVVESFPLPGGKRRWVVRTGSLRRNATAHDLSALVWARTGLHVPAGENSMLSAFGVRRHVAARMSSGRVMLIGDAAHEVSPIGGQGMNLGWLDAAALAPLLARGQRDLRAFGRARRRSAQVAATQAELNMLMGRPLGSPRLRREREALLHRLLASPLASLLARAFTMRWL